MSGASVKPKAVRSGTALLLVDFLNDFRFPGGNDLVPAAIPAARRAAKLKARAAAAGAAAIYVNDNLGDWKSDWRKLYGRCARPGMPGAAVARPVKPRQQDYFLFKPRHSAFYGTALEPLLEGSNGELLSPNSARRSKVGKLPEATRRNSASYPSMDHITTAKLSENHSNAHMFPARTA